LHPLLKRVGAGWGTFRIIPVESGRGCPYGCEFCTVTGFFGDSIRFRTNESVVNELLLLKARAREEGGQIAVFFIDDNFAINVKRTKSLLRDIIAADAQVHWVAQISANLLRDEELVDLIAAAGGKWIFIGMESIDPANLADVKKGFNKPGEYAVVLDRLARRNVFAITSFIFGMDNDTAGVAERTLKEIRSWPPGLPIFGLMTPLPATPLYKRLEAAGRLTRPKHWLEFAPFRMAHTPLKMSVDGVQDEVKYAWTNSYSPAATRRAQAILCVSSVSSALKSHSTLPQPSGLTSCGSNFVECGTLIAPEESCSSRKTRTRSTRRSKATLNPCVQASGRGRTWKSVWPIPPL
jgi:radical SAM superfamily enzyme YgiQ (UPF0313 family)